MHLGGPDHVVAELAGGYECVSSSSNPPAEIVWQVRDSKGGDQSHLIQVGIEI